MTGEGCGSGQGGTGLLRPVQTDDVPIFFVQQADAEAVLRRNGFVLVGHHTYPEGAVVELELRLT